ncbi:MAG: hypothetical protein HOB38_25355 [Deltaproteobacteria bacterium]|nr:hypothetical protein [Deltaproteobacteria bacterium]
MNASCNFSNDRGKVLYDPVKISPAAVVKIIAALGYGAVSLEQNQKRATREFVRLFITLLGSAFIFLIWLALMGTPLWGALIISIAYGIAVFRWV